MLKDLKESLPVLILCSFGEIIAGMWMGYLSNRFIIIPALIILIPPSISLRGNIYAPLGSRLGTYLHAGKIEPKFKLNSVINENISSSLFLLIALSFLNGIISAKIASLLKIHEFNLDLVLDLMIISIISAFLSAVFIIPLTIAVSIGSFRWGWDPDNVTSPLITFISDLITIPLIFLSADLVFLTGLHVKVVIILISLIFMLFFYKKSENMGFKIIMESFPILLFCLLLEFCVGTILGNEIEGFVNTAGVLTIVPAFLASGGAMGSILVARFSSMLHLGSLKPYLLPDRAVFSRFFVIHLLALISFAFLGVSGFLFNVILSIKTPSLLYLILATSIAGQILALILDIVSYYFSIISFKIGFDPDNVGIPLVTSLMDFIGISCLVAALKSLNII